MDSCRSAAAQQRLPSHLLLGPAKLQLGEIITCNKQQIRSASCRAAGRFAWMLVSALIKTRTELWFGHGCSGQPMPLEHAGNYGLGMDALVSTLIKTRTELWFGNGCSGQSMLLEHEGNYGLSMDALVSALIKTRTEL